MTKFNVQKIKDYLTVFGLEKMLYLWSEYTAEASRMWDHIDNTDWEQKRMFFHNWRSGAKIFGMDNFAHYSQLIEENILKKRLDKASKQIPDAKEIYINQVKEVEEFFRNEEQNNG